MNRHDRCGRPEVRATSLANTAAAGSTLAALSRIRDEISVAPMHESCVPPGVPSSRDDEVDALADQPEPEHK